MSLNECTRKPISSRDGSGRRVPKSPLPTARVPAIEVLHRPHQPLRGKDRAVDRGEHRQQQHQRQRQPEADLQRLAQRGQFAVLRIGALHGFGQLAEAAAAPDRSRRRSGLSDCAPVVTAAAPRCG